MSARSQARDKTGSAAAEGGQHYQCCFCGEGIAPKPPDVCALVLHRAFQEGLSEETQTFFCHAACLKERLLPGVPTVL
jgi:hypothetical protein